MKAQICWARRKHIAGLPIAAVAVAVEGSHVGSLAVLALAVFAAVVSVLGSFVPAQLLMPLLISAESRNVT